MKTSSIIISLLVINSSFLAGHLSTHLIGNINPLLLGGSELILAVIYYFHTVLKDVRNAFDVDVMM